MGPVACPILADAVPRRAVRKVGPRPDLTRSTHAGEPCGPARLLGDGNRSSCSPYRATYQSTGGDRTKNEGVIPRLRVAGMQSPRAASYAVPGALVFFPRASATARPALPPRR